MVAKQQPDFRKVFLGLDQNQVDTHLEILWAQIRGLTKERDELLKDKEHMHKQLEELRGREESLRHVLWAAEKAASDMKAAAQKEYDMTMERVRVAAQKLVEDSNQHHVQVQAEISWLKKQREHILQEMYQFLVTHMRGIEQQLKQSSSMPSGNRIEIKQPKEELEKVT